MSYNQVKDLLDKSEKKILTQGNEIEVEVGLSSLGFSVYTSKDISDLITVFKEFKKACWERVEFHTDYEYGDAYISLTLSRKTKAAEKKAWKQLQVQKQKENEERERKQLEELKKKYGA